jgi:lipase
VAVALHGITGSAMSWQAVARQMPPGWTLAAPDLRGRGHSAHLPGPYGLERHAADVTAVLRHFGGRPVLAGHSMGAYVALLTRDAHPGLCRRLVMVDGGLPLPLPDGVDPEEALTVSIGPAIDRLRRTFPSTEAYLDFWRAHPALAGRWTADVEAYARYDLTGEEGSMRSRVDQAVLSPDSRDVMTDKPFAEALGRLTQPTPLLTAPAGFTGEPPGLLPPELVDAWAERVPHLRPQTVPGVNHYTIVFDRQAAATVARAITTVAA